MRKLSELLPIARTLLISASDSPFMGGRREYTCHAAGLAEEQGKMLYVEYHTLREAIEDELELQSPGACAIACIADEKGVTSRLRDPVYIAFRDKWLDTFQAKLVSEGL